MRKLWDTGPMGETSLNHPLEYAKRPIYVSGSVNAVELMGVDRDLLEPYWLCVVYNGRGYIFSGLDDDEYEYMVQYRYTEITDDIFDEMKAVML